MRKHIGTLAVIAAAAGLVAAPLAAAKPSGEERLAELIEGKVAGEPQNCLPYLGSRPLTVIDKTAIVYKAGDKVWVNRTAHPEGIDEDDILVIRHFGSSRLCRSDVITLADRFTGMFSGVIFLEDFVPYEEVG